ncbi:uncharacterized protein LOC143287306 [Babylonia areolata]|uniref:uncharacterized protein LOC143287306 n=1 Tax=Babylonia areolata TaxID=304850 RepID=UPI003FD57F2D
MPTENGSLFDSMRFDSESQTLIARQDSQHTYNSISVKEESWETSLSGFLALKQGSRIQQIKSKRLRSFYKAQDDLIDAYEEVCGTFTNDVTDDAAMEAQNTKVLRYSQASFCINVLLTVGKLVASILSGSMSIISSLVDSVVDLLSGVILWWAARAIRQRDLYTYPQGRTRLEPVAVIILAVVMSMASLELVRESVTKVLGLLEDPTALPSVELITFLIAGTTIVVKLVLWLVCRRVDSGMVQALAMDHRNDVLSNSVAIVCGYLGSAQFQQQSHLYGFIFVDPGGAILISIYIIVNWCRLACEQMSHLTGLTARPDFLSKVTWLALHHHRHISQVDTVRAFHIGVRLLVDVDIVLGERMPLREAHDIGESLQQRLERLPEVERAYVHVDFETSHRPCTEHKLV